MTELPKIKCRICGKQFTPSNGNTKLCSEDCKKENKRIIARKYAEKRRKENPALMGTKTCIVCGKEFPVKNWNQKTCSEECILEHRKKSQTSRRQRKKETVVKVKQQRNKKQIPLVLDSIEAEKAGTSYGKYKVIPYIEKQSEEMALHRRELDLLWERKRNEKKNR